MKTIDGDIGGLGLSGRLHGAFATTARGGTMLILNEYNCVSGSNLLDNDNSDTFFGRVEGNGDNWIELVVTGDHADIRGWQLRWLENDGDGNGIAGLGPIASVRATSLRERSPSAARPSGPTCAAAPSSPSATSRASTQTDPST